MKHESKLTELQDGIRAVSEEACVNSSCKLDLGRRCTALQDTWAKVSRMFANLKKMAEDGGEKWNEFQGVSKKFLSWINSLSKRLHDPINSEMGTSIESLKDRFHLLVVRKMLYYRTKIRRTKGSKIRISGQIFVR